MATYEYDDKLKFVFPSGFMLKREENDEGDEVVKILAGEYEDDDGDTCYSFQCQITELEYDPDDMDEDDITSENLFDKVTDRMEDAKKVKVANTPETYFMSKAIPLQIFGRVMKMFGAITIVRTSDWGGINILSSNRFNDDDLDGNATICKNVFEVLKAVRVDGKKIPLENISPEIIQDIIESSFDFDSEAIDVSPTIKLNITTGNETRTLEYTSDGMKEVGTESLTIVEPDEELYPHYQSIKSAGGFGLFGANVVVNASGTEYSFEPLSKYANSDSDNYEMKEVFERIVAKDTVYYDLHEKAKEMQSLFHVNEEVFDSRHDRECELEEGLMHRAYMMSGLRSFAWTLADYCANHDNCEPEDIDSGIAKRIANFVAHQDWLNYDDTTYCTGLCAGSDLHVYFIPDSVSQADRKKLLPSDEDIERVKDMKARFPSYREILCEVHSLDDLREDLEYIYPAVRMLWEELEEKRDYDKPLTGNEADIVYAWCALALAAKGPFFTEDGPTSCFFDQIGGNGSTSYYDSYDNHSFVDAWMEKYSKYVESNPYIDFNGKLFVFSGFGHGSEKEHPIVQQVIAKGGQYRSKVSGLTDYLVVDPAEAGSSKIVAAMEQLQKGKKITVVLLEDLERALEGNGASKPAPVAKTTASTITKATKTKAATKPATVSNDDLSAQISEMDGSNLTPEQVEALGEAQKILGDLGQSLAESEGTMEKYSDFLEQQEKRAKEAEEKKTREREAAKAAGKREKDGVNMYVILTNEKKLGKLHRSQEEFYEIYEDDFAALSKDEVLSLRKDIMSEMEDDDLCGYYRESFKQRSVEDRFTVSTLNLNNVSDEPDIGVKAQWAIDNTTEWYQDSERAEVKRLMDADLAGTRADLDAQFDGVEKAWKKFSTGKSFLKVVVSKKTAENSKIEAPYTFFKVITGDNLVEVKLATGGLVSLTTTVMDCQPWYWDVTVRDIWEAAMAPPVDDGREGATDGTQVANQALSIIRTKYPKSTATTTSATSTTPVTSATPKETPAPKTTSVPASSSSYTTVSKTVATPVKEQPSVTKTEVSSTVSSAAKKEKPKAKKTNKAKAIAIAVALSVVAIAVFIILLINVIVPNAKYNEAMSLVSDGRYEEALLIFEELDGHKDSVNQIKTTRALQREATLNSSKYSFLSNLKIGDTFKFGEIEQDNNTNNGAEEIEWIVLDKKDGEILVISKYCIYAHEYNATVGESYDVTWSNSDMRAWLNREFYKQLFSSNEQSLLNETKISSDSDILFLLSVEEAERYFDDDEIRKTTATPYAKTFYYDFGVNGWRLRSNGGYSYNPSNVTESGEIDVDGYGHDCLMGVRPAMWIAVE